MGPTQSQSGCEASRSEVLLEMDLSIASLVEEEEPKAETSQPNFKQRVSRRLSAWLNEPKFTSQPITHGNLNKKAPMRDLITEQFRGYSL